MSKSRWCLSAFLFVVFVLTSASAQAHFPWLATDKEGHALLFFSEGPAERDYRSLPEAVANAKVLGLNTKHKKPQPVELKEVEKEGFTGRISHKPVAQGTCLATTCQYGIYHGTLLSYFAKHVPEVTSSAKPITDKSLKLDATPVLTKVGIDVIVTWEGKPLPGANVTLIDADSEKATETTDNDGLASFATQATGLTGFIIGHTMEKAKGEFKGEAYESESYYFTLTCQYALEKSGDAPVEKKVTTSVFPELPEAIASFGAVVCDGWLYVYSGHTGKAHDHSCDNLSQHFRRVKLGGDGVWEELPMQTPLQGLPLVTHGGKVYRVGGLNARNKLDEEDDLHSVSEFVVFDPQTLQWTELAPLPEARSSHDAVVIGDTIYVAGGWTLSGSSTGEWLNQAYKFDLSDPEASWQPLTETPFYRRALATSHWQGKLIVMCGMSEDHSLSQTVDCYDPATGKWSQLADFPGEDMHGFGVSAWNEDGQLFACGNEGVLYRLSDDGKQWQKCDEVETPRFFHRIVPGTSDQIMVVGGASFEEGHMNTVEFLKTSAN